MFLINVKTSGQTCSGRITEIDPRGGAAITGPNGAGKTTTLQLLPLFFGHSPAQIARAGENREAMLRFVLPNPECAIVFEYQRGNEPGDVCLAVLRRQPQSDAPEYRFFEGPFRAEYFVSRGLDGEVITFLDDATSVEAATRLGTTPSAKQNSSDYRNIILNTIGVGQKAALRRQEARQFSFSKKRLSYLDRVVAAIVKQHINFADFTEVAAKIVTERMMGREKSESKDKQYPQLRQSKEQIERWLRDRDGAERALKLKPIIELLREVLNKNQQQEITLGQKHADVQHLRRIKEASHAQVTGEVEALDKRRTGAIEAFNLESARHDGLINEAEAAECLAAKAHRDLKNLKLSLEESDAPGWAKKTQQLPALKAQADAKKELIDTLQAQAQGIVQQYDLQIGEIKTKTATTASKMKEGKEAATQSCDTELALLDEQETSALLSLDEAHGAQIEAARLEVEDLVQKVADANSRRERPSVEPEIEERLTHARTTWGEHQETLIAAQSSLATLATALQKAKGSRDDLERQVQAQKQRVRTTEQALSQVRARVQPADGTLHAALLNSSDEQWRETLARVINPDLLTRTDLHAHVADDGVSLYRWALNLDVIEAPTWTQRDVLDKELETASHEDCVARAKLAEFEEAFAKAEKQRLSAVEAHDTQMAHGRVIEAKSANLKAQLKACEDGLTRAKATAKTLADDQHSARVKERDAARTRQDQVRGAYTRAITNEKTSFSDARAQVRNRRNKKCHEIDVSVSEFERQQAGLITQTEEARDRELTDKGIDTGKLNEIKKQYGHASAAIRDINDHADLVRGWDDWLATHGQARFVDAEAVHGRAQAAVDIARSNQDRLRSDHKADLQLMSRQETTHTQTLKSLAGQISTLEDADRMLAEFPASGRSSLTDDNTAAEIKGSCSAGLLIYHELQDEIKTKSQRIERELCEVDCSAKEFVLGVLNEPNQDKLIAGRAACLVRICDRIPQEVVVNVHTSLSTILDNIGTYRRSIQSFESQVKTFNGELQTGLERVSRSFDRFADFKASVVTDFDKIDFIGKLKLLDNVVLEHRAQHHASYSLQVPTAQTAESLRTFMMALSSGTMEVDLGQHITLSGSVTDDGNFKTFHNEAQLEQISSNGLTAIALIILLSGLINVIRGKESIYIPWGTDEVGRFDPGNFQHLMQTLKDNLIDVVTTSPALTPAAYKHFARLYAFEKQGFIAAYQGRERVRRPQTLPAITEEASS